MDSPGEDASEGAQKGQTVFAGSYLAEAYVECGGLSPRFAVGACPDVLPARRTCDAGGKSEEPYERADGGTADAISSPIASAASRGFAAPVIGRPITR